MTIKEITEYWSQNPVLKQFAEKGKEYLEQTGEKKNETVRINQKSCNSTR